MEGIINKQITKKSYEWRIKKIQELKQETAATLKSIEATTGMKGRLSFICDKIRLLSESSDSEEQLHCFIYIMFALVHHEQHRGLPAARVGSLLKMGYALLKVNGIKPSTSKLSYLYGELHLIKSQILINEGDVWLAAWELQISKNISGENKIGSDGFHYLSLGIRNLAAGNGSMAMDFFERAEKYSPVHSSIFQKARVYRCKSQRLSSQLDSANELTEASLSIVDADTPVHEELTWERTCTNIAESNSLHEMISMVRLGKPHYHSTYVLEAFLWSRAVNSYQWFKSLPKLTTILRKFEQPKADPFCRSVRALDEAYDTNIPMINRLNKLGQTLNDNNKIKDINKRLLIYLAATRWLIRSNQYNLARLTFSEYESLSLRVSNGINRDGLGIANDLVTRIWKARHAS
ncbi:MAG: hypothetical protein CMP10_03120 [Zetaproteobacteria bacterium]|nr:hypothetical protein [Pseudobdellovibrionaceae bacterium]